MSSHAPHTAAAAADAHARSKRPRSPIAGPYGHPFHPIMVTVPIGAWISSLVFDIVAFVVDDPEPFAAGATVLIVIGLIGAVLAAILGLLDYAQLENGTPARRTATIHLLLNLTVVALFVISLVVRLVAGADEENVLGFVVSLVGVLVLGFSGYLGGKLAYHFGVRVAAEGTQAEGFR